MSAETFLSTAPLAHRVRPRTLSEFVGQAHVLGEGKPLRRAIEEDKLSSVILAGPPGTGKTTLAKIIAERTSAAFVQLSAVTSGVKDLKRVCEEASLDTTLTSAFDYEASSDKRDYRKRTVLFIDEIHRFNKAQQDALLPFVENGYVILIGATTENPYFEVNKALVSRSRVEILKPLEIDDLITILKRALAHPDGFDGKITMHDAAVAHLARIANGDARAALNALELSVMTLYQSPLRGSGTGQALSTEEIVKLFGKRAERYDKSGEDHYDVISAFIKTMRGSDPDAALLWMFRMIESGEEPRFLFRRMAIFASEDIGNADPRALQIVVAAWQAFEFVGLPEGEFFLAHACIYLAQAPKSNSVKRAKDAAKNALNNASTVEVPNHLRNAPIKEMKTHGASVGYKYPHDDPRGVSAANYFPIGVTPQNFYEPTERGFEIEVRERLERVRRIMR